MRVSYYDTQFTLFNSELRLLGFLHRVIYLGLYEDSEKLVTSACRENDFNSGGSGMEQPPNVRKKPNVRKIPRCDAM
jgi:hypothetical protein